MLQTVSRPRLLTRCAIYTRKSVEQGLDREVNSLEVQRETCAAYITSQKYKDWVEAPARYDDGGYSGGTTNRPALQRLLADVEAARIDVVVVYKLDRLTRSLTDFVRLTDLFNRFGVSFVSITQAFDTSDSMGRLVLNVLLTFAQFEREMMGDRIRDKFAALRRRGKFIGGNVPFGYRLEQGKLVIEEDEAAIVRRIYDEYPTATSGNQLLKALRADGVRSGLRTTRAGKTMGGNLFGTGILHRVLTNPLYLGFIAYKDEWYPGEQPPIITRAQWDEVQRVRAIRHADQIPRDPSRNILLGILYDGDGRRMRLDQRAPEGRQTFRYYSSEHARWAKRRALKRLTVVADDIEMLVQTSLQAFLVDRTRLGAALGSLGIYGAKYPAMMRAGPETARRVSTMDRHQLRLLYEAVVARAEVSRTELRLFVSCPQLVHLLGWDGQGLFRAETAVIAAHADRVYVLTSAAALVREHRHFALPMPPASSGPSKPNKALTALLERAAEARAAMLANRGCSIEQLARDRHMGPSYFGRLVRLTYLAPDIQAAIVDGHQPPDLTPKALIYSSLPLDWEQHRQLLGFT